MKKAWKRFVIVVSALMAVIIVCVSINVFVDAATGNVIDQIGQGSQQNGGFQGGNAQQGGSVQQGGNGAVQPGTDAGQQGGNVVTPQGGANNQTQAGVNPLSYNKSQLIAYYNSCLKKSYTYRLNATKVENVDVRVSGIDIGNLNMDVDKFAQNIISNNTKNNGVNQVKTFSNGKAGDGTTIEKFVLPANLYDAAVKSITVSQDGQGYKVVIVLNQESCTHTGRAAYNASCAWPLDINVIDFGSAVTINECTFNYPGTKLTAKIDAQGRVYDTVVEMPLTVSNAKAKAMGINITVGSISGKWTCHNTMTFAG